jgi:hypothetical protein
VIHLAGHRSVRLFLQMYDGLTGLGRRAKRTSGCRCWHLAVEKGIYISADRPLICQKLAVVGEADLQQLLHQIKLKEFWRFGAREDHVACDEGGLQQGDGKAFMGHIFCPSPHRDSRPSSTNVT